MATVADLSQREIQVLRGIANDRTYPQIGHELNLSHETIKSYASRLRAKLGCDTKIGLALWATANLPKEA